MKIDQIITESLLFEQQLKEDPVYKDFYSAGMMLVEYKMSQEQIKQLFKAVADGAAAGGNIDKEGDAPASNRTLLGKGADAASTITKAFDKVKTKISQSGPVSGFDVAVDNIQTKLLNAAGGEKGAVGKALAKYREFAHKHPVMQGAIYAGLIALAGISGAGLGGAALLGGIKVFDKLLQGDKASSALWSGFKTGAIAYGASQLGQALRGGNQMAPANPSDFGADTAGGATGADGLPGQFAGGEYTVMKGDTLGHIAQANGVPVEQLKGLNPQIDFSKPIQPGMTLSLPPAGDNAGSVWQGYTGGTYGDQAAGAAKGASDMVNQPGFKLPNDIVANNQNIDVANAQAWVNADAAERLDIEQTTGMSAEKLQSIVDTNKLQPGTSPNDAASAAKATGAASNAVSNVAGELTGVTRDQLANSPVYQQAYADAVRTGSKPHIASQIATLKAKAALLKQSYVNPKPMLEYIDRDTTVRTWVLRESVGKPRGGVALTEAGRQAVFRAVSEGPWDDIKAGAGKFVKGLGQGFTNPGVRNIKNLDTSQMAGAQVGAAGNKLAKGYGKLAGMVQKGADAVSGVVKKGWDSATNKITYDKLDLNWRKNYKEFDPTGGKGSVDSEVVANFLRQQGVKDGLISSVYKQLGIPFTGTQQQSQPQDQVAQQDQPSQVQGQPSTVQKTQQGSTQGSTQPSTQSTASNTTAPAAGQPNQPATATVDKIAQGIEAPSAGAAIASALKGAKNAWERGTHTPIGASLVEPEADEEKAQVTIRDRAGNPLKYNKVGNQWVGADGKPITDAATVAMLDQQAKAKAAQAGAAQPATTGTNQPAQGQATPANKGNYDPNTGAPISDKAKSDAAFAASPQGQAIQAKVDAMPAPAGATATAPTAAKPHTGGKVAGQLSQTPGAIKKRAARAAASSANQAGAGAFGQMAGQLAQQPAAAPAAQPAATTPPAAPKFGPGVSPQATMAPSKVTYKMPAAEPAKPGFLQTATDKIRAKANPMQTAGKINRGNPVTEQIDIAESLWRKMKSKK